MKRQFVFLMFGLSFGFIVSCGDNIVSECEVCTDKTQTVEVTTFADIQQDIFNISCISCHSGNTPTGGLDLSPEVAYDNLVGVPSNASSLKRIEPFNSSASYLIRALEGNNAPPMPPGLPLSQAKIDSIKSWIDRGAQQ